MMLWKCCTSHICQQIWKTQERSQDCNRSIFIPIPKKVNAKQCSNYCTIALISHTSKVMLKILQARLHSTWTVNFQMFKLELEKAGYQTSNYQHSLDHRKSKSSRKTSISALLTTPKPLTVWITTVENSSRDRNTRPPDLPPEKSVCRSRSNR